ncbi:hypothetical protein KM043_003502 [Ampulex compressa]|nr:hypothetical protein KM043_003502 [Ampulex compressa]
MEEKYLSRVSSPIHTKPFKSQAVSKLKKEPRITQNNPPNQFTQQSNLQKKKKKHISIHTKPFTSQISRIRQPSRLALHLGGEAGPRQRARDSNILPRGPL